MPVESVVQTQKSQARLTWIEEIPIKENLEDFFRNVKLKFILARYFL